MFDEEQLNEFINRMFENANSTDNSVKEGLTNFRKYLKDTKMCEDSYLTKLDLIIKCSSEILALKRKIGTYDVMNLLPNNENKKTRNPQKKLGTKKYTSTICGTGSVTSDFCGSSSSSSDRCGGGSSYSNRC